MLLFAAGAAQADGNAYLLGGGLESDTDGAVRGSLLAGIELGESTWLSGGFSASSVDLASGRSSDTLYGWLQIS